MITDRQAKIEAYEIIYGTLTSLDVNMWDDGDIKDQIKIVKIIHSIDFKFSIRADKLKKRLNNRSFFINSR